MGRNSAFIPSLLFQDDEDIDYTSSRRDMEASSTPLPTKVPLVEPITPPTQRNPASVSQATPGPTTSTVRTPPPLLCSVDHQATTEQVYPPSSTCDILIYTNVRIANSKVAPVMDQTSFNVFGDVCGKFADTSCGLSFDARYTTEASFDNAALEHLRNLPLIMDHFAMMNVYGTESMVSHYVSAAVPGVVSKMGDLMETRGAAELPMGRRYCYCYVLVKAVRQSEQDHHFAV
ncbi:uncharacterized protein LOC144134437 [Amblyomma americanum]